MRLPYVLAFAAACVSQNPDEDSDETSAEDQELGWRGGRDAPGEIIHVEGDAPGGSRGDPWWGPGPGKVNGGGAREGGVAGSDKDKDKYEPQPKDCLSEKDKIACEQCCDWNTDKVDYPACKKRYRNDKKARRDCLQRADRQNHECMESCKGLHIFEAIH
jgi:hypothetical protein